ncbi:hypothetical protein PLESTB_001031800 [Pleodorina starrii]|uniref:Uncharacterized protein n=1 Tax=Pleodorina starrii TaxID=330485 RepID=A0A9W6F4T3_9CHLO|nr:hypothetical protein PLESTB_001031800 [Pleodorina starrii]
MDSGTAAGSRLQQGADSASDREVGRAGGLAAGRWGAMNCRHEGEIIPKQQEIRSAGTEVATAPPPPRGVREEEPQRGGGVEAWKERCGLLTLSCRVKSCSLSRLAQFILLLLRDAGTRLS